MDVYLLADDLARLRWAPPHHIQAVNEEYEYEEPLLPLNDRFMQQLPPRSGSEFALLPIEDQVTGRTESSESYVNKAEDSLHWPEYEGMEYVGVEEDNEEEWFNSLQQRDEITVDVNNKPAAASQDRRFIVVTSLATKRIDPITEDNMLLRAISPSAPHIATIGLQEPAMPGDASTPATFGPTLEPVVSHQQHHQTVSSMI